MSNDVQCALPIGTTLHHGERIYTIKKVLGIGGFGITYLAEGLVQNIKMQFAVKEFFMKDFCDRSGNDMHYTQASSANVEFGRKSFYAEANRLNQQNIKHHNLVSINEVFEENNTAYYLMEYIKGKNPSENDEGIGDNYPVNNVSWYDCQEFIRKLNSLTGANFRLPTEAEWEFAARGGNRSRGYKYSGSNDIGNVAWNKVNSDNKTQPVATKSPNELGIYDMSGNVWEWCSDYYGDYSSSAKTNPDGPKSGSNRVVRGGGKFNVDVSCSVFERIFAAPYNDGSDLGFRLAADL